jgi:exonuclease I
MTDPGLHSKFIEMQQEEVKTSIFGRFVDASARERCESLRQSRSRILEQLRAVKHPKRVKALKKALKEIEKGLRGEKL